MPHIFLVSYLRADAQKHNTMYKPLGLPETVSVDLPTETHQISTNNNTTDNV